VKRLVVIDQKPIGPHVRVCDSWPSAKARQRTTVQYCTAVFSRTGTDVYDPVRLTHHVEFVLDDEQRVARRLETCRRDDYDDESGTPGSSPSCRSGQYVTMAGSGHEGFFERGICSRGDRDHDHRVGSSRGYPTRTRAFCSCHDHRRIDPADGRRRRARSGGARTDRTHGAPTRAAALTHQSAVRRAG
jgi:hypothetical protein